MQGFTLIEVMVVVVILGLLASIIIPNVVGRTEEAKLVKAKQDILALENALMSHPSVLEAAVIAVPDAKWIERPFAYIVLKQGKTVSIDELREFLAGKFAKFWIPDNYAFIEAIPKTSVGKFLKSALREKYEKEHS